MRRMKVHWSMVGWGLAFGLVATVTGAYVLAAVESGGFFAEGFFLLVVGWVIVFAGVAKLISRIREERAKGPENGEEGE